MSKLVCEYCGNWMEDTDEKCPTCAAANPNHKRIASTTPTTIEELQDWYRDRNLPSEDVTRFYIGKDDQVPGAYGIYKNYTEVVLYKNRADGTRAIRYKGSDEEYAVNELYLKLKEEILNQKAKQQYQREQCYEQRRTPVQPQRNYRQSTYNSSTTTTTRTNTNVNKSNVGKTILIIFLVLQFGMPVLAFIPMILVSLIGNFVESKSDDYYDDCYDSGYESFVADDECYYVDGSTVYYYEGKENGNDIVWQYNPSTKNWSMSVYTKAHTLPFDEDSAKYMLPYALCNDYPNFDYESINIENSRTYLDANYICPLEGYYVYDGDCYYFYEKSDTIKEWYKYSKIDEKYLKVCFYTDKQIIGDDLYYDSDEFFVSDDYDYFKERISGYEVPDFALSEWVND